MLQCFVFYCIRTSSVHYIIISRSATFHEICFLLYMLNHGNLHNEHCIILFGSLYVCYSLLFILVHHNFILIVHFCFYIYRTWLYCDLL